MDNEKNILKFTLKTVNADKNSSLQNIKNFNGYDYIKSSKDLNGVPFVKENLIEYSNACRYMVRVMRETDNKIYLYNYYVSQEDLAQFLIKFDNKEYDGKIIEVEKYIPEELA